MRIQVIGLIIVLLSTAQLAGAHETKTSGTLDILLHMEPLDNPAARDEAQMYFSVSDSAEKFKYADCDCSVTVMFGDREILNRKVTSADDAPAWGVNVVRIGVVFPELGIYRVFIEGRSLKNTFADFNLEYDKRIERESETVPRPAIQDPESDDGISLSDYYIYGGIIIVVGIIVYELFNKKRKKKI